MSAIAQIVDRIASDVYASSFQSLGQYRAAVLEFVRALKSTLPVKCEVCDDTGFFPFDSVCPNCSAGVTAAPAPVVEPVQQAEGTTSDKYRAELYDEVWQLAKGMGYGNVTMALSDLAAFKAQQAEQKLVATIVAQDPEADISDEGPYMGREDWLRLQALPPGTRLYAHIQHASGTVSVPVELLRRALKADASMGASAVQLADGWKAMSDLRALLSRHERGGQHA